MTRQTGKTRDQMTQASYGAHYVWLNNRTQYAVALAKQIGRSDLRIVPCSWLDHGRAVAEAPALKHIVVDHACKLTIEQADTLVILKGQKIDVRFYSGVDAPILIQPEPLETFQVTLLDADGGSLLTTPNIATYGLAKYIAHEYSKLPVKHFHMLPQMVTVTSMLERNAKPQYMELHVNAVTHPQPSNVK